MRELVDTGKTFDFAVEQPSTFLQSDCWELLDLPPYVDGEEEIQTLPNPILPEVALSSDDDSVLI